MEIHIVGASADNVKRKRTKTDSEIGAKDYQICCALFHAYIAKVSKKKPNLMTDDRREISEQEILTLIDWYLDQKAEEGEHGIEFESDAREGMKIQMVFVKKSSKGIAK